MISSWICIKITSLPSQASARDWFQDHLTHMRSLIALGDYNKE